MTTETGCRVSVEELKHDRDGEERQQRRSAAFVALFDRYRAELSAGDIAEALADCPRASEVDRFVYAIQTRDADGLAAIHPIVNWWIAEQATRELVRKIDRGDL